MDRYFHKKESFGDFSDANLHKNIDYSDFLFGNVAIFVLFCKQNIKSVRL
jgi:hypothetical protein